MTPSSDRISTRKRRRSATAAGMKPPAVDYRLGPGGTPRPSSRGVTTPPQARRWRLAPPAAATPTLADQPARTVPFPSDHDRAEPMGTPLLRHASPPGDTPATPTRSDALDDAAELRFADSAARYSHADWKREQHAKRTCHATMRYIFIGRPSALPPDVLACYPSPKRPSLSDIQELASEGRLHTTDDDIVLLVPNPTLPPTSFDKPNPVGRAACWLNDEPTRIYVPLLMRPWIMQACQSTASCHLGATRALRMLERFNWRTCMNVCTRWWLLNFLKCQARQTGRLTVRWLIITMPLPEGPVIAVSVDYFGPLSVTPQGNTYILLFTDRFSRRADMFLVTATEFTPEVTANFLVNLFIPLWGCPRTIPSDNGLQFCSKLSQNIYQLFGAYKLATSSYHPNCNGGVERVNQTMAQMLVFGRQRATRRLRLASAPRKFCLQQLRQRGHGYGAQRGPHGQTATESPDGFRPHWCRGKQESGL